MKNRLLNGIWLLFLMPALLLAQPTNNIKLAGRVIDDKTKFSLVGASVHIKGTNQEMVTDNHGDFSFNTGQQPPYTLIISFVGYQTGKSSEMNVSS